MTKKSIITLSIIMILIVLTGILFGTVFCLRSQKVVVLGETPISVSKEEIISSAGLENGSSIFLLDKDKAIANIEAKHADVKVIQIKTISVTEVEIRIRARHAMYYSAFNDNYYILDEELKVLEIKDSIDDIGKLTHIEDGALSINQSTTKCDFVGSKHQQDIAYNLYNSMINTFKKSVGGESDGEEYYTRSDVREMLTNMRFETFTTFDKIILTTSYGVKLDIENPSYDLKNKINRCYNFINKLIADGENEEKSGTIKIYYDLDNNEQCVYIP